MFCKKGILKMKNYFSIKKSSALKASLFVLTALSIQPAWCMDENTNKDIIENTKQTPIKNQKSLSETLEGNIASQPELRLIGSNLTKFTWDEKSINLFLSNFKKENKIKMLWMEFDENWTEENTKAFFETLKISKIVTTFCLRIRKDSDLMSLSTVLGTNTSIKKLRLEHKNSEEIIDVSAIESFSKALKFNEILTELRLENINIGEKEIEHFSEVLKANQHITRLYLVGCKIGNKVAKSCFEVLKSNEEISTFDLHNNEINDQAVDDLAEIIESLPKERKINIFLEGNKFTEEGEKKLLETIKYEKPHKKKEKKIKIIFKKSIPKKEFLLLKDQKNN